MKLYVQSENGFLPHRFGKHGNDTHFYHGSPCTSFPIEISDYPEQAKTFALIFYDLDSIPVCGFAWIHWLAANIKPTSLIKENASIDAQFIQGYNSSVSKFIGESDPLVTRRYHGPMPPDKDHIYTLTVYALDTVLDLTEGFYANHLLHAIKGHVLDQSSIELIYPVNP